MGIYKITSRIALILTLVVSSAISLLAPTTANALSGSEFQAGRIIDDSKFFSGPTMSVADIQNFLNSKVPVCDTNGTGPYNGTTKAAYGIAHGNPPPYTCLKEIQNSIPAKAPESGLCNGITASGATAAEVIYWVSESCGINPQVLIVLLQKEQGLVTDDWPWPIQYRSATGYGCPDGAPCDAEYYGFFNQVYNAARQFKRYALYPNEYNFKANINANVQYNPNAGCGSSAVFLQNQATAGLYNYTPYQPNAAALNNLYGTGDGCSAYGNRNFWRIFNDWFGSTFGPPDYSCKNATNVGGAGSGAKVVANRYNPGDIDYLSLIFLNNSGSACLEVHTWNPSFQSWANNIATNHPAVDPADSEVIRANVIGDSKSELLFVRYRGTGSGKIELHIWDPSYQRWANNIATNHPAVDPANDRLVVLDTNGDGHDELALVKYRNTGSGRIEIHTWNSTYQGWTNNIATNHPAVDPANDRVIALDVNGDGHDELALVKYQNSGSSKIEIHTWLYGQQNWYSNIATNHPAVASVDNTVLSADINNDRRDELILVRYRGTGSGRIEVHTWGPNQQSWISNIATNHPVLP